MRLGYNTNGFAHHRLLDAIAVVADIGYRAIAITLDVHHLDPFAAGHAAELAEVAAACRARDLVPVVETGARFLLDPRRKHRPTLLSADPRERAVRIDFLARAIDAAAALGAPVVSLWSGAADDAPGPGPSAALDDRLAEGLRAVCARARAAGVVIGFEPEPGMYVEDMAGFARVRALVGDPALKLTLDVGHAHITEAAGAEATVRAWAAEVVNVHVEGMRRAEHDHLVPWEGDLDVRAVLATLADVGYRGPACFELSRHSHDAARIARRAFELVTAAA
ncbi:MAG TPA: sugar phosphate isomerase/epimerase [Kofleriaceae bacterium]|nr:sugar phosphate isomerase/epimerase [Kofleriaceae bacterium]